MGVTRVEHPRAGLVRIRVRYRSTVAADFRIVPLCGSARATNWLVASSVRVLPRHHQATLELRDDFAWLADSGRPCRATGLAVEVV